MLQRSLKGLRDFLKRVLKDILEVGLLEAFYKFLVLWGVSRVFQGSSVFAEDLYEVLESLPGFLTGFI